MDKKCSKCETVFSCQNEKAGCWCEHLTVSPEMLQFLKEHYDNCLCSSCLLEFSEGKPGPFVNENVKLK